MIARYRFRVCRAGVLLAAVTLLLSACATPVSDSGRDTVVVGGKELEVWVADTEPARVEGLMAVPELTEDEGMLFIWDDPGRRTFVIKDVEYDLDVAFIANDGRIVSIERLAPGGPERAESSGAFVLALETRAGWFEENGIAEGDSFEYSPAP